MSRKPLLIAAILQGVFVACLFAVKVTGQGLLGYGTLFDGGWHEDELLGDEVLKLADPDTVSRSDRAKESSEPFEIDGQSRERWRGWFSNGQQEYEEDWLNGKQHGLEAWWDDQGQKTEERNWKNGYLHGRYARWYSNGQLAEEVFYQRYHLHGAHSVWGRDGRQRARTEYRDGLREGQFIAWYPNGAKRCEASFRKDRLHGVWQNWDASGELLRKVEYRNGTVVSETPVEPREPLAYPGSLGAADFAFILSQGSGWHGYNTLRVSAAGRCDFCYYFRSAQVSTEDNPRIHLQKGGIYLTHVWRRAQFALTDEMQRELRDALQTADVFGMKDEYVNEKIADGTQWIVRLRADGKAKRVYCSNKFPDRVRHLSASLRDQIMAPHQMELLTASRIEEDSYNPDQDGWLEESKE